MRTVIQYALLLTADRFNYRVAFCVKCTVISKKHRQVTFWSCYPCTKMLFCINISICIQVAIFIHVYISNVCFLYCLLTIIYNVK